MLEEKRTERARKAGSVKSEKKTAQARLNLAKAREAMRKYMEAGKTQFRTTESTKAEA